MTEDEKDKVLVHDRDYSLRFFKCPSIPYQLLLISILGAILSFFAFPYTINGIRSMFFLFLFPALFTAFVLPYLPGYQIEMNHRQSTLFSLLSLTAVTILFFFYVFFGTSFTTAIVFAYGVIISFRYLVIRSVFLSDKFKSLPSTYFQSIVAIPFLAFFYHLNPIDILLFLLVSLVSLTSIEVFIATVNRPFLSDFDISTLDMVRIAFQVFIGKDDGRSELEEILRPKSIKADVDYTGFHFVSEDKNKAMFLVPNLHPGPIKGIGGYDLTEVLYEDLKDHGEIFTFHGPSTHSLNPLRNEDIHKLSKSIDRSLRSINYYGECSDYLVKDSGVTIGIQKLGRSLFTSASFSPRPSEDIDPAVGRIVSDKAERFGFDNIGFVDAHNCAEKGCSEVYYPSRRAMRIIRRSEEVIEELKNNNIDSVKMGISVKKDYDSTDGIGGEGVKVAVFEIDETLNAYILFDGNNMVAGLREMIQEEICDIVNASEIFTTDSHKVNTINKDYNPVGKEMEKEELVRDIRELLLKAMDDLEEVKVGSFSGTLKDFKVMGPINTDRLNAVAETIYKMAPFTAALSVVIQALATLLILSFL